MSTRDLSLSPRKENIREKQLPNIIHFSVSEIKDHFDEAIKSIEYQFEKADVLLSSGDDKSCNYIWRSQVVFTASALDFYLHEISKCAFFNIFKGQWPKTEKYNNFMIPMGEVEKIIHNPEQNDALVEYVIQRFGREVYLSYESMKNQLNMLGINFEPVMKNAFPDSQGSNVEKKDAKKIIRELFDRRNQIAHQLDQNHFDAEQQSITKLYVEQYINDVKAIVNSIHGKAIEISEN